MSEQPLTLGERKSLFVCFSGFAFEIFVVKSDDEERAHTTPKTTTKRLFFTWLNFIAFSFLLADRLELYVVVVVVVIIVIGARLICSAYFAWPLSAHYITAKELLC